MSDKVQNADESDLRSDRSPLDYSISNFQVMVSDIQSDRKRIKGSEPEVGTIHSEIHGTILSYIMDIPASLIQVLVFIRSLWQVTAGLQSWADTISTHLEVLEERLEMLEDYGTSTTILPDDFDVLQNTINGIDLTAKKLLVGPFPITAPDEAAKQALAELIAMANTSRRILERGRVDPEDLEDEDLEDEIDDEIEEATSTKSSEDEPN